MKSEHALLAVILLAAIMGGGIYYGIKSLSITNQVTGGSDRTPTITLASAACDPQGTPRLELLPELRNKNDPNHARLTATVYVYEGDYEKNNLPPGTAYLGSFTTSGAALTSGNGFNTGIACNKKYTLVATAVSGGAAAQAQGITSGLFKMKTDRNSNTKMYDESWNEINSDKLISNQSYLQGRVRDEQAQNFVYASTDASAGTWHASGTSWYSTTGNLTGDSDGLTLGVDGYYKYKIYVEVNTTV